MANPKGIKELFGGVSTKPDVERLVKKYPSLKPGDVVLYGDIAEAISEGSSPEDIVGMIEGQPVRRKDATRLTGYKDSRSYRFYTVLSAWRKRLYRESNLLMIPTGDGEGLRVASPSERIELASAKTRIGKRAIVRASVIATTTDKDGLTPEEIRTRDHLAGIPARLRLAEITSPKSVE